MDAKLKLYNTLTKKKEAFVPVKKDHVGIYSCGPTVYSYQHIGNLRTSVNNDLLKRLFLYNGYSVNHITNVTDVGHLTSDADTGEDKIERAAERLGKSAKEVSNFYFSAFKDDLKKLNVLQPDMWPKASEHIKEMIALIKTLEKKGYTYKTSDGIYFDTSKFSDYGKLAGLKKEGLKAGKRVAIGEKKHKTDFALWKFSEKPGTRQQEWESPWGTGFPGWHIECSVMATKYIGDQIDIHTGGQEHIPVHHTNEIAQSEAGFGKKPWVKYWVHFAWLLFAGEKISKSRGGSYLLADLEENGYEPMVLRYLFLTTHYKKPLNFSFDVLDYAQKSYERLKNIISEIKKFHDKKNRNNMKLAKKQFVEIINDDINSPKALAYLWDILRDDRLNNSEKYELALDFDRFFGLELDREEKIEVPREVRKMVKDREEMRKKKNFEEADNIRNRIKKLGYAVEDIGNEVKVRKV